MHLQCVVLHEGNDTNGGNDVNDDNDKNDAKEVKRLETTTGQERRRRHDQQRGPSIMPS
jgi:hypothetical protein